MNKKSLNYGCAPSYAGADQARLVEFLDAHMAAYGGNETDQKVYRNLPTVKKLLSLIQRLFIKVQLLESEAAYRYKAKPDKLLMTASEMSKMWSSNGPAREVLCEIETLLLEIDAHLYGSYVPKLQDAMSGAAENADPWNRKALIVSEFGLDFQMGTKREALQSDLYVVETNLIGPGAQVIEALLRGQTKKSGELHFVDFPPIAETALGTTKDTVDVARGKKNRCTEAFEVAQTVMSVTGPKIPLTHYEDSGRLFLKQSVLSSTYGKVCPPAVEAVREAIGKRYGKQVE